VSEIERVERQVHRNRAGRLDGNVCWNRVIAKLTELGWSFDHLGGDDPARLLMRGARRWRERSSAAQPAGVSTRMVGGLRLIAD
jgi:hypothetical protein